MNSKNVTVIAAVAFSVLATLPALAQNGPRGERPNNRPTASPSRVSPTPAPFRTGPVKGDNRTAGGGYGTFYPHPAFSGQRILAEGPDVGRRFCAHVGRDQFLYAGTQVVEGQTYLADVICRKG